jgi:hypothetical protein
MPNHPISLPTRTNASVAAVDVVVGVRGRHLRPDPGPVPAPPGRRRRSRRSLRSGGGPPSRCDACIAEHHRNDRMAGTGEVNPAAAHPLPEPLRRWRSSRRWSSPADCEEVEGPQRGGGDRRGQRVGEQVGPGALRSQSMISCRPAGVAARCAAERLAERAGDDVDPIGHPAVLGVPRPPGPTNPTAWESSTITIASYRSASSQIASRSAIRRPSRTRRRWRSAGSGRRRLLEPLLQLGHVVVGVAQPLGPCTAGCRR